MSRSSLKRLQRRAREAKRALKSAQSETRLALQLLAQLDQELTAALSGPAQPEEAQHADEDQNREIVHA